MNIRPATPGDKTAIIHLLRDSLGESTIPKSEALWTWKHEQNPFGPSFVLVAEEGNRLIGLRAFMQWEWKRKGKIYRAIRAVDTATHPGHQGKGVFKKLTLRQAELCRQQGVHFIFNTPNEQSRPGYLKMGWVVQDNMPLKFKVLQPFSMAYARLLKKKRYSPGNEDPTPFQKWTHTVFNLAEKLVQDPDQLSTVLSPQYLSWRYGNNPLFRYNYFTDHENYLLVCRIKEYAYGRELRLVDFILLNPQARRRRLNTAIRKAVLSYAKAHNISFISFSGQQYRRHRSCFRWMGFLPVRKLGPLITLKDLNMKELFPNLLKTKNWCYSLGDMELF